MWKDKQEVINGLSSWLNKEPGMGNRPIAKGDNRVFTLREVISEIQQDTENGKKLLKAALSNKGCDDGSCDCGDDHG